MPEPGTSQSAFRAVRGGVISDSAFPEAMECSDAKGVRVDSLRDVTGEVLVVGHGNANEPRLDIAFGPAGTRERQSLTADELAEMLVDNGLACDHEKVTLLIVQGGLRIGKPGADKRYMELLRKMRATKNEHEKELLKHEWGGIAMRQRNPNVFENNDDIHQREIPFVAEVSRALSERGFLNVKVGSFRAEVLGRLGSNPTNPGPYQGLKVYVTASMLAAQQCKAEQGVKKFQCIDNLMAPCDACLMKPEMQSLKFGERCKACQLELLKSPKDSASAQICGAEALYASSDWYYEIAAKDTRDTLD